MKFWKFTFIVLATFAPFAGAVPTEGTVSLSLEEAIALALKNDHDVIRAQHSVESAKSSVSAARGAFFPRLDLDVSAGTFHDRNPIPGDLAIPLVARDRNSYIAQLRLTQPIFAGFKTSSSMTRAESEKSVKDFDLEIARQATIEKTIELYFSVQLLEKNLEAEREAQKLRETQLTEIEQKARLGGATSLQELQARYSVKEQVPKILMLESEHASKSLKLYRALGLALDGKYDLTQRLPSDPFTPEGFKLPTLPEAFEFALKNSLKIRRLEAQSRSMQAQSGEALSRHLPSLNLLLNAGTNAFQRVDLGSRDSFGYGVELKLTVPLFSGLESVAERSVWQAKLDELKEERAKIRETLLEELNDAYRKLEITTKRMEAAKLYLDLAERTVTRAREFQRMGRSTLTDVLDSFTRNLEAKKQNAQDAYDRVVALFRIKTLLGLGGELK